MLYQSIQGPVMDRKIDHTPVQKDIRWGKYSHNLDETQDSSIS